MRYEKGPGRWGSDPFRFSDDCGEVATSESRLSVEDVLDELYRVAGKFHSAVCGRPSINLDTFMATPEHVRELFEHYGADADVCVVEGMMGLFDGYDRDRGSAAEIARVLNIPVVLVVDAKSAAYSMAALLSGFIHFRADVNIAGVIFNKVGSARHFNMLRQVCDDLHIRCFGYLPKSTDLEQGSRYLGLDFSEIAVPEQLLNLIEENIQWEELLKL